MGNILLYETPYHGLQTDSVQAKHWIQGKVKHIEEHIVLADVVHMKYWIENIEKRKE